jgi:acetyl-CoA carboxylase carboxyl transferase subunit beta
MSWLEKLLPPKIQPTDPTERRTVPEGLWIKCPACETVLYKTDLEQNLNVCPKCATTTASARARARRLPRPEGPLRDRPGGAAGRPLKFKDSKKYPERLKAALESTGETDALVVIGGAVMSVPLVAACFEFDFMGGSMGSVVGERFVRGVQAAIEQKVPFVSFAATGGARMQEGLLSLMQMAKTNAALTQAGQTLPYVSVLTDPDHGRRVGQLRLHGRPGDRRAQGAGRLRRAAGDREHRARKAAGGLPARRVPAAQGAIDMIVDRRQLRDDHRARAGDAAAPEQPTPSPERCRTLGPGVARLGSSMTADIACRWLALRAAASGPLDGAGVARSARDCAFECPVVTVAGTNGKGSTCAMLESIALAAGWRVGSTPRRTWCEFNERCRIDGESGRR